MKEHDTLESDNKNKILLIKKEIININKKIDEIEKRADEIAKKDNCIYIKFWNLQQNKIIRFINKVNNYLIFLYLSISIFNLISSHDLFKILQIDDYVHSYLDVERTHFSKTSNISALPFMKIIIEQIFDESLHENLTLNSYGRNISYSSIRNKALNDLIFDLIIKSTSIEFDYNLNRMYETKVNSMQNFPYAFGTLNLYDIKSWNIMKSKFKPYVMCKICNSLVNWEFDENNTNLEERCTIPNSG